MATTAKKTDQTQQEPPAAPSAEQAAAEPIAPPEPSLDEQVRQIATAVGRLESQMAAMIKDLRDSGLIQHSRVLESYKKKG